MKISKMAFAGCSLWLLAGCDVTFNPSDAKEEPSANATAAASPEAPQAATPYAVEQFNAQAEARAREAALRSGTDQLRAEAQKAALAEYEDLKVVVDISDRELTVLADDKVLSTHKVAVGTKKWPTPVGSWQFHRVDINPEWNPPKDEEWAKDETKQAPGALDNPLGKARLVYRMPNTVHGTADVASLGKASSHGSIRVANDVVLQLAERLLKSGGAWQGDEWFSKMSKSQNEEYQIRLERKIPIEVKE